MNVEDGAWVTYVGPSTASGPSFGDEGQALAVTAAYAHVQWRTGSKLGQIDMVATEDYAPGSGVVPERHPDELNALDFVEPGLDALGRLEAIGALAPLSAVAEEAVQLVHARVRQSPGIAQVLAGMDPEDGDAVVEKASSYLLHQAMGDAGD